MNTRIIKVLGVAMLLLFVLGAATAVVGMAYREYREGDIHKVIKGDHDVDPNAGLIITAVDPDGPAAKMGVVRGDILLQIGDQEVNSSKDLQEALGALKPGDEVSLRLLHGSELRTPNVILGDKEGRPYLGITLCCGLGERLSVDVFQSLGPACVIVEVLPDTPAEQAGLQSGDLILAVDGEQLNVSDDLGDIIGAYEPGDRVTLEIMDNETGERREVSVQLDEHPEIPGQAFLGIRYSFGLGHRILGGEIPWGEFPFDVKPHDEWHPLLPDYDEKGFWFFVPDIRHEQSPPFDEAYPLPPGFEGHEFDFSVPPFHWDWFFDVPDGEAVHGVVILEVVEGSPADQAGLMENDVITAIDDTLAGDSVSIKHAITSRRPGDSVVLNVFRPETGEKLSIEVRLGEHPDDPETAYLGVGLGPNIHLGHYEEENIPFQFPYIRPEPLPISSDA